MPAAPPVINVTPSVGPFRSDREILNAFGDAIVKIMAYTWLRVSRWCFVEREYVRRNQPRLRGEACGERTCRACCVRPHLFSLNINHSSSPSGKEGKRVTRVVTILAEVDLAAFPSSRLSKQRPSRSRFVPLYQHESSQQLSPIHGESGACIIPSIKSANVSCMYTLK